MFDYQPGDILVLKAASVDLDLFDEADPTNPRAIIHPAGTEAIIERIEEGTFYLSFPNGEVMPHLFVHLAQFFTKKTPEGLVYRRESSGLGTPPWSLFPYLPLEANPKHNYRYKVTIELEDRGLKYEMCRQCSHDVGLGNKKESGLSYCSNCKRDVETFTPQE